jgi:hypothetical protein
MLISHTDIIICHTESTESTEILFYDHTPYPSFFRVTLIFRDFRDFRVTKLTIFSVTLPFRDFRVT